jgi:hypothetical protein
VVRWITAGDNSTARRVYDAHATATPWVTTCRRRNRARQKHRSLVLVLPQVWW